MKKCKHLKTKYGPRFPSTYGSYETLICKCGAWKIITSGKNEWKKSNFKKELNKATQEDEDR